MQKYANYIKRIEIDSLWSGKKHILWELDPHVNVLSGVNGMGKSTILNKVFRSINTNGDLINHLLKGVHLTAEPEDATSSDHSTRRCSTLRPCHMSMHASHRPLISSSIICSANTWTIR